MRVRAVEPLHERDAHRRAARVEILNDDGQFHLLQQAVEVVEQIVFRHGEQSRHSRRDGAGAQTCGGLGHVQRQPKRRRVHLRHHGDGAVGRAHGFADQPQPLLLAQFVELACVRRQAYGRGPRGSRERDHGRKALPGDFLVFMERRGDDGYNPVNHESRFLVHRRRFSLIP